MFTESPAIAPAGIASNASGQRHNALRRLAAARRVLFSFHIVEIS